MKNSSASKNIDNVVARAKSTSIRVSPRKLALVANMIKGMKASDALIQLSFNKKRIANDVKSCLMSAIANAENNHMMNIDDLFVTDVAVGKSILMKRFRPMSKGRAGRIEKFFSNLTITVSEIEEK